MEFTVFTLAMTVFWVSIFVKIISSLRKQMTSWKYFSIYPLLLLLMFCILRVIFPLELPFTTIILSKKLLPPVQRFLYTPFYSVVEIDITLFHIILGIWAIGTGVILIKQAREYLHFRHTVDLLPESNDMRLYEILDKARAGNLKEIKIKIHKSFRSPAIIGFVHPVIIMPKIELNDDQLLGIFIHEVSHYKLKHHVIKLITEIIQACFWWNPIFRTLSAEVTHALEMHSDKMVCSRLDKRQLNEYLQGILKVMEIMKKEKHTVSCGCGLVEDDDDEKIQQRFEMILNNGYQSKEKISFLTILLILGVFVLSYGFVVQPYVEPTLDDIDTGAMILEGGDPCYYVKTENGYEVYDISGQYIDTVESITDSFSTNLKPLEIKEDIK
ncbi:MAG: M56 family metallopeptidase [Roseburia sp.]|nr:M56 family metallopeptidase [Roseburia sp.]